MLNSFLFTWSFSYLPVEFVILPGVAVMACMSVAVFELLFHGVERAPEVEAAVPFYREGRFFGSLSYNAMRFLDVDCSRHKFRENCKKEKLRARLLREEKAEEDRELWLEHFRKYKEEKEAEEEKRKKEKKPATTEAKVDGKTGPLLSQQDETTGATTGGAQP